MLDGLVKASHDVNREVKRAVLTCPVVFGGRHIMRALGKACRPASGLAAVVGVDGDAPAGAGRNQHGQEAVRAGLVHQNRLDGVAHAGALRLGVLDDAKRHGEVGLGMHVDVAVALPRLDDGHAGLLDAGLDKRVAAARDEDVHEAVRTHELDGLFAVGAQDDGGAVGRKSGKLDALPASLGKRGAGVMGGGAATKDDGVARAKREADGVGGDVGPGLIDHGDDTERDPDLRKADAGGKRATPDDLAERVGLGGDFEHPGHDAVKPGLVELETVEKRLAHAVFAAALHVSGVGLENGLLALLDPLGSELDRLRTRLGARLCKDGCRRLGGTGLLKCL